jgi:hypothetical protein
VDTLEGGDWIGKGAKAFYREMGTEIMPSLKRLSDALQTADRITRQISQIMQDAEQEAAAIFWMDAVPDLGLGTPLSGARAEAADGKEAESSPSPLGETILSAFQMPFAYKAASGADTIVGFASVFTAAGFNPGWVPSPVKDFLKNNPYLKAVGKGFAFLGFGLNGAKFVDDPSVQSGADLTVSGIGLFGALGSGPGAFVAGAFAGGYAIGSTFIAPYTTDPISKALTKWDLWEVRNLSRNYPRTTIKDYQRSGKDMPMSVARDVYLGLRGSSLKDARRFAKDYSARKGISTDKFHANTPWMLK